MHGPIRQKQQDGGADVAASTAAVAMAPPSPAAPRAESEAGTKSRARAEAAARAEAERIAAPGVMPKMLTHLVADLPVGVAVLIQAGREAESTRARLWVERKLHWTHLLY